jgi:hypothetical protein
MRREWNPNARLGFNFRNSWMVLVDLVGIEPTTSSMPWKRAPSCATGPLFCKDNCSGQIAIVQFSLSFGVPSNSTAKIATTIQALDSDGAPQLG